MTNGQLRRRGARNERIASRSSKLAPMLPTLNNVLLPVAVMNDEQIARIDAASMAILEDVGVTFRDPVARDDWQRAGAKVVDQRVYIDRHLLRELLASLPSEIAFTARNPAHNVAVGGTKAVFVPMSGASYVRDLNNQRRLATLDDLAMFHKLAHMLPSMHSTGHHIVDPSDIPVAHRHLHITYSSMVHSDKMFMGMTSSGKNAEDVLAMCDILFGEGFLETHAVTIANISGTSPLVWDTTMTSALRAYVSRRQPVLCTPFTLGGANTPASVPASVAQINAETLSGLAYTQVVRKGAPAIYGAYLSTVSMKTGMPLVGTPEASLMNYMLAQMARHYAIPFRSSGALSAAKTLDAQAGYEGATTLMSVMHAGANVIWQAAGWAESGLLCSVAKFMADAEQCAMAYKMASGPNWDNFDEALVAVSEVGPSGRYFEHPHTMANFKQAFFMPEHYDGQLFAQWEYDGEKDLEARSLEAAKSLLQEYQPPPLDNEIDQKLRDFIARRESEVPADAGYNERL